MLNIIEKYEDKIYEKLDNLNDGDSKNAIQLFQYITGTDDTFKWFKENDLDRLKEIHFEYKMQFDFANEFADYLEEEGLALFHSIYEKLGKVSSSSEVEELVENLDSEKITELFQSFSEYFNGDTLDPDFCPELEDYVNSEGATILELGIDYFIDMDDKQAVITAYKQHNAQEYQEGLEAFKQEQGNIKALIQDLTSEETKTNKLKI